MTHSKLSFFASLTLAASCAVMIGCNNDRLTAGEIRRNPTPTLDHLAASHEQIENAHARVIDNNTRGIWSDLDRLLLLHRSSRLQPYTLP